MRVAALLLVLLALSACAKDDRKDSEVHCFNQGVTLPSYTNVTCPTINP